MNFKKPKFWDQPIISFWSILLFPFSLVFLLTSLIIKIFKTQKKFSIPIICIGNIVVGGAGKTPVSLKIGNLLLKAGYNPNFISKGYAGLIKESTLVENWHSPASVGDESLLLSEVAPTWVGENRTRSSFLAYKKLKLLNRNSNIHINYKPILLGGLHKLGDITAPAFNERKMKNMKNDCELVAKKNTIEFKWNNKFPVNSLNLMRGYLVLNKELKKKFFDLCFDAYWKDNIDLSDKKNLENVLDNCSINKDTFFKDIQDQKIKDELKHLTESAFKKDIFGAPTFVVNDQIFWGQDRLDYALDEYNS